jgi:ABC-type Mn2+/Zn2+ transport system permease subunit
MAQEMYRHAHGGDAPSNWHDYLLGRMGAFTSAHAVAALAIAAGVIVVLAMLGKEIVSYCFDPAMAEVSGVRVGLVHYLLIVLVALAIVVGMQITGPLLVPALLILPGATALLVSRRMRTVLAVSVIVGLIGALGGLLVNRSWTFVPQGPAMVLVMFVIFLAAYAFVATATTKRSATQTIGTS